MQALLDAASSFLRHCPLVSATLPSFGTLVTVAMRCAAHPEAATAIAALRFLSLLANMPQACGAVVGEPPPQQQPQQPQQQQQQQHQQPLKIDFKWLRRFPRDRTDCERLCRFPFQCK